MDGRYRAHRAEFGRLLHTSPDSFPAMKSSEMLGHGLNASTIDE